MLEIIFLILVIYVLWRLLGQGSLASPAQTFQAVRQSEVSRLDIDRQLAELKAHDGNFSRVLLIDFASLLYHKFYTFKGTPAFKQLSPYLSSAIISQAQIASAPQRVHDIVIGKAQIADIAALDGQDCITVDFESNLSVQYASGEDARFVKRERWLLTRKAGVLSAQPAQMRSLSCPSCGAPADFTDAGECQYCHTFIQAGEQQWQVAKVRVINTQKFTVDNPSGYVEETGTELPTLKQASLPSQQQAFVRAHGLADWQTYFDGFARQVVKPYFLATYSAWSRGQWPQARHLVSDRLYESNDFWMQEYARQGWQNRLDNIEIQQIVPARIDLDKFYESITVRVYASCIDYTVDKRGAVIGGSNKRPRRFSEYWTFIRVAGVEKITAAYDLKTCPSCGAPADKVGQAGVCGYCGSKLSEGNFSWVLAVIAQDEAYEG
ncbi:MAG: transporter [Candidatus Methylumidiphilus sp.]